MNKNMGRKLAGLVYATKKINNFEIEILFTNAPETYDSEFIVKSAEMDGCRMLDCPPKLVEQQIKKNASGLYWTTSDIEEASLLRRDFPYWSRPDRKEATDKVLGGQPQFVPFTP